jgi:CheY-like chemotaxis protein
MQEESIRRSIRATASAIVPATGLRVMVVDDNLLCRTLLAKNVARAARRSSTPITIQQHSNGQEAVDAFSGFQPHLVFTDVSMPVMDGVIAAQHMRAITSKHDLPVSRIYAFTGLGASDPRLLASGMMGTAALDGWLVKGKDDMKGVQKLVEECIALYM